MTALVNTALLSFLVIFPPTLITLFFLFLSGGGGDFANLSLGNSLSLSLLGALFGCRKGPDILVFLFGSNISARLFFLCLSLSEVAWHFSEGLESLVPLSAILDWSGNSDSSNA